MNNISSNARGPQMGAILSGFTCCPACLIDGRPQAPRRALPGEFSRVLCLDCNRSSNEFSYNMMNYAQSLPQGMRDLVVALTSWTHQDGVEAVVPYRLNGVRNGSGSVAAGLPFDGLAGIAGRVHVDVLFDEAQRQTMIFAIDANHANDAIEICFLLPDANRLTKLTLTEVEIESQYTSLQGANLPAHRATAVKKLLAFGFRITHADVGSSLARIQLSSGDDKVKAEFHWNNI